MIRTAIRHKAHFSVTVPMNSSVRNAIARIPEDAWTAIRYPQAIWDDRLECRVSDAEVAETRYTAFASKPNKEQVTARLIVRLITMPARTARHGHGNLVLHLPAGHHREQAWLNLWTDACGPPARAA